MSQKKANPHWNSQLIPSKSFSLILRFNRRTGTSSWSIRLQVDGDTEMCRNFRWDRNAVLNWRGNKVHTYIV
eukprot:UN03185